MLFSDFYKSATLPDKSTALPDRPHRVEVPNKNCVTGNPIVEPVPEHLEKAVFGMGCFWGAERLFWQHPGVYSTAVGYAGGITANPSYEDVCSGRTGHTEVVLVYYDPSQVSYGELLKLFWESHDPTQGMRQGNDRGTQYRSAIYTTSEAQAREAAAGRSQFTDVLQQAGYAMPTTEIRPLQDFYYAEDYHQQYLAKNPGGYCGLAGTGQCYEPVARG